MQCCHDGTNKRDADLHNPVCREHALLDLLGCAMRDKLGFRDHLRIIRESQNPPAKPVQTEPKPKSTAMDWMRNGFRFPEKGAK